MQLFSVHITKLSVKKSCIDTVSPDLLILLLFKSHPIHENTCRLVCWWLKPRVHPCQPCQHPSWLSTRQFLLSSKGPFDDDLVIFGGLKSESGSQMMKCQSDSDLHFSSSSEYRASTKPCRASSLFKMLD